MTPEELRQRAVVPPTAFVLSADEVDELGEVNQFDEVEVTHVDSLPATLVDVPFRLSGGQLARSSPTLASLDEEDTRWNSWALSVGGLMFGIGVGLTALALQVFLFR